MALENDWVAQGTLFRKGSFEKKADIASYIQQKFVHSARKKNLIIQTGCAILSNYLSRYTAVPVNHSDKNNKKVGGSLWTTTCVLRT